MELPRFAELLTHQLNGIADLSPSQISALHSHFELLLSWNPRINLTSVRSPDEIVTRHYCESIFLGANLPDAPDGTTIIDLGAGAGFPGVPMAVLRPGWQVTLLESHQRKAVFLRESTRGWPKLSVISNRANAVSARYDWLVSRAVRVKDVLEVVPRLSQRVGLLMGEADLDELQKRHDIAWSGPLRLPWGERRICVFGSFVSRGT